MNSSLRGQCVLNGFGFISNDNNSRARLWKDGIHLEDLGSKILAGFGNIGVLISVNSISLETARDISNLGSESSNWNSCKVKVYDKNSSDPRLVLENLKLKNNHRLVIGNLNINSISNKFGNLKLIIQGKIDILVITETKTDSTFPLNQFEIQGYSKPYSFDRNRNGGGVFIYV